MIDCSTNATNIFARQHLFLENSVENSGKHAICSREWGGEGANNSLRGLSLTRTQLRYKPIQTHTFAIDADNEARLVG